MSEWPAILMIPQDCPGVTRVWTIGTPPRSSQPWDAVGTAVTRCPPHGSPRAAFPHEALILDVWRQSAARDKDGALAVGVTIVLPIGGGGPSSSGTAARDGAMSVARIESPSPGNPPVEPGFPVPRGS